MKKLFITLILAAICSMASAQENVQTVLKNLATFVDSINVTNETPEAQLDSIDAQYTLLTDEYKAIKKQATGDQIEEYYSITTLYKRKMSNYYSKKTGEKLDKAAENVINWTKRQYKKAKGTVEGMKKKK